MREFKDLKIAVAGTGYVGLSIATLLSQHHKVTAVDIIPEKVELINNKKSPIQDEYIEKYLAEKELDLTATLDAKEAYSDADFVVIAAPTNYDSKAWGIAIAIVLICYFTFYRKKKITIKTLLLFVPLVVTLAWNQIYYYFFSSIQGDSARYQLLINSFKVIKDHFPIGSGFGTYASYYSGKYYSPIYSSYGMTGIYGLTRNNTSFISDSFWPMVFAQTGLIGTVAFGCALLRLFKKIQKIRITSMAFYASAISVLSYLLIASTAESAFVHPVAIPIALWLGVIMNQDTFDVEGGDHPNG